MPDTKILKVLSLPTDDGGCGHYRVRQPLEMIKRFTEHDTHVLDDSDNGVAGGLALSQADIIVTRSMSFQSVEQLRGLVRDLGKEMGRPLEMKAKIVFDIDDCMEAISPYNYHYDKNGTEEFFDNNIGQWLWKDGVDGFNLKENRERMHWYIEGMKQANLVTVTTPKLAEYARQYNKNVAVLPNCINFERWWKLDLKPNKQLRVGWSGGVSHYEDFFAIKEPLNELMRKYQFKLVMAGSHFEGIVDEDNRHLVEIHDWTPFKGHSYRMMCMALDIAIIPLADLPFNHYKSAVKWYEMSAMGVPSLVSNVTPYKEEMEFNECRLDGRTTALPYDTPESFYAGLEILLKDADIRINIGANAQKWVKNNRDAKKQVNMWIDAYQSLLTDKP